MAAVAFDREYRTLPNMTSLQEYKESLGFHSSPESRTVIMEYGELLSKWRTFGNKFNQIFKLYFGNGDELLTRVKERAVVRLSAIREFPRLSPPAIEDEILRTLESNVVDCRQSIPLLSKMHRLLEERYFSRGVCLDELIRGTAGHIQDLRRFIALRNISDPENYHKVSVRCDQAFQACKDGVLELNELYPEKEEAFSEVKEALNSFGRLFYGENGGVGPGCLDGLTRAFDVYKSAFTEFDHSTGVEYFKFINKKGQPVREFSPAEEDLGSRVPIFYEQPPEGQIPLPKRLGN